MAARSCPREVVVCDDGVVVSGSVRQGDLLAIHTSARRLAFQNSL